MHHGGQTEGTVGNDYESGFKYYFYVLLCCRAIVRLGEHDLKSEVDCVRYGKATVCADKHVDVPVETIITHPRYNPKTLKNDVALVRVLTNIPTTGTHQP